MRATTPQGPFVETATTVTETFAEPIGSAAAGEIYFYKVVATNAAGDAVP
jgi:hypothetical protein